ncbi:hypothetical protein [Bailinhaonella thermotolerans]|uniref:Uncharacterized protein n=1 Tax=Bailinhaonella thermotolerans TaxID=1070861 RepID=A0A3A4AVE7_9ACTN|nr:hypothetical protein [Bailinhaonella thermotolerans]RJL34210.1 hypothetical protein D5H75_06990 [Bailinhaonella thermotolerans]
MPGGGHRAGGRRGRDRDEHGTGPRTAPGPGEAAPATGPATGSATGPAGPATGAAGGEDEAAARTGRGRRRRDGKRPGPLVKAVAGLVGIVVAAFVVGAVYVLVKSQRPARAGDAAGGRPAVTATPEIRPQAARNDVPEAAAPPPGAKDPAADKSDTAALQYFWDRWGRDDKAVKRVKDIRNVGGYFRVYTDLPESADNSKEAITLCERAREYLRDERGVTRPVIFVQARFGENGNPVLANILGPKDKTCKVTYPEPKG